MGSSRDLTLDQKILLRTALVGVHLMEDPGSRDAVRRELRKALGQDFNPLRGVETASDVWEIAGACLDLGEIRKLIKVLTLLGATPQEVQHLANVIEELFPGSFLDAFDLDKLKSLLAQVSARTIVRVIAGEEFSETGVSVEPAPSAFEVLRHLAERARDDDRLAWIFLESVAHSHDERHLFVELHLVTRMAALALGKQPVVLEACEKLWGGPSGYEPVDEPSGTRSETDDKLLSDPIPSFGDGDVNARAITDVPPKTMAVPTVYGGVPPQNMFFSGRSDVLDNLRTTLESNQPAAVLPHTLRGLGGVGKTQVAVEYTHRNKSEYDLVWWIPADDERSIRRSFSSLAGRLNIRESTDVQNMIEATLDQLRLGKMHARWLLVFDNAGEPEIVRPYLPAGPGHVLITSRSNSWKGLSAVIEVDVFDRVESVEFLKKRWEALTEAEALHLAEKLGFLPLALDQAAAVHQQTGMPLAEYLELLDASPNRLLAETPPTEYPISVAKTYRLAFDELSLRNPAAGQLLQVCAFLSSNPIWVPMLRQGRGARYLPAPLDETLRDEFKLRTAVRDIGRYALAQLDENRDFIKVHPLVRAVLRDGLPSEDRAGTERVAHEVLALANPGSPDRNDTWPLHKHVAPHVNPSGVMYSVDAHVRQVVLDQIRYLFAIGDYDESRNLAVLTVDDWRSRLGPEDEMTLLASLNLGNAQRSLGEYEQARKITEETAAKMAGTFGAQHEYTLRVANSVTADLRLTGEFRNACAIDETSLEQHKSALGDNDPVTLRAANNLAVDYRLLGDFSRAKEIDEDTLRRRTTLLGEDNPETLSSINSLARDLYGLGQYWDAAELQKRELPFFVEKLSSKHRFILMARRNLAILTRKMGDYGPALELAEANFEQTREQFRSVHEYTLAAMMTLSNSRRVTGDLEGALDIGQEALETYRERFRAEHPFTLACMVNLAIVYRAVGRHNEAMELDSTAIATLESLLGPGHPYTLSCAANMTNNLALAGRLAEAHALSENVVARSRAGRVPDHPYTLLCEANLALDLIAVGQHQQGTALREETTHRMQLRLGPEHPETVYVERGKRAETDIEVPPM